MLGYQIPTRAQLLLLFLQTHLCLLSSLGAGAAGLSFSYDFSIPDPGGIHRKDLTYRGGKDNSTGRVFYSQAPLRLWDGRTGKQASFNTSFTFAMVGGTIKKPNGTRPKGRRPMMAFFVAPWPIPTSMPWYWGGGRIGTLSNDPTSTAIDVDWNTRWDDRKGYDPAADAVVAAADRVDYDNDVAGMHSDAYTRFLARGDDLLSAGSTVSVDIIYDAGSSVMELTVRLLANGRGRTIAWTPVNLKEDGLPQDAVVGLSAAKGTGDYFASPIVISWSFSSTDPSIPLPPWVTIASCVATALLGASLVAALFFFILRKRWAATTVKTELKAAKEFSYQELSTSTNNSSDDRKLGLGAAGSFSKVHRGALNDPHIPPEAVMKVLTRPMEPQTTKMDYIVTPR